MKFKYFLRILCVILVSVSTATNRNNSSQWDEYPRSDPPWKVINSLAITRLILSLLGVFINACNSIIIWKLPGERENHFKFILSLAIADMSLCFSDLLNLATFFYYTYIGSVDFSQRYSSFFDGRLAPREAMGAYCVWATNDCFQFFTFLATLFSVIMIAVDCFLKTKFPLRYRTLLTPKRVNIAIGLSWILAFAISAMTIFVQAYFDYVDLRNKSDESKYKFDESKYEFNVSKYENFNTSMLITNNVTDLPFSLFAFVDNNHKNSENNTVTNVFLSKDHNIFSEWNINSKRSVRSFENGTQDIVFLSEYFCESLSQWGSESKSFLTGICSLICFILMMFLYCCIYCGARNLQRRTERRTGIQRNTRKTLVTTILIVLTFFFAWGPVIVIPAIFDDTGHVYRPAERAIHSSLYILQVLNATLDALIYAIRLEEIRKRYTLVIWKLKCGCFGTH